MASGIAQQRNTSHLLRRTCTALRAELGWVLDLLLPDQCPLCLAPLSSPETSSSADTKEPLLLCPTCSASLTQHPPYCCPRCDEPYNSAHTTNHVCRRCLKDPPPFMWIKTATLFNDRAAQAMHRFKYQGETSLAAALAQCILLQLRQDIDDFNPQLLVPVPLHSSRLRQRGYNQSLLLTRALARQLNLPIDLYNLKRTRATSSQTLLSAIQRQHSLRSAFSMADSLEPQRILLVDDVVTTTATARACTAALRQQGHSVAVVALGRATLT